MAGLGRGAAWRVRPEGKLAQAARARVFALLERNDPQKKVPVDDDTAKEFAELGYALPAEAMDQEDVVEIWDINVAAFNAFQAMDTQWRLVGLGGLGGGAIRTGLDYAGVEVVMRMRELPASDFALIQAMETGALEAYGEARQ